jgi:glutamyl-tRNA reductase
MLETANQRSMNPATLFLVGATHRTAPFGFREKLALGIEGEAALAAELRATGRLQEFVILNTCNRVEIYGIARHASAACEVVRTFCGSRGVPPSEFDQFGFVRHGRDAVEHLLEVASGLDSQMLGETEIFGQVKRAYATAQVRNTAGPVLNRLFQKAFQAAKHVRTHTGVTTGQISVTNVAVDLALPVFGGLATTKILILGAGEMAKKSARAFRSRGAQHLDIASRRFERAEALAQGLHGKAIPFERREAQLGDYDIVVCSTSAPDSVVSFAAVRAALAARRGRPMLLIDLAMPRDIEPAAGGLENVFLYNLDDLAEVAAKNRQSRLAEADAGRIALGPRIAALWGALQFQLTVLPSELPARIEVNRDSAAATA